ncbi:MAG: lamin tail domain-containing protein [Brevefilum sp.]
MKKRPPIYLFIILNVFVSAAVTLLVLWVWDLTHPAPKMIGDSALFQVHSSNSGQGDQEAPLIAPVNTPEIIFLNESIDVVIYAIVGPGNIEVEYVEIRNQSPGSIDLTGWQLQDEQDNSFIFPAMILNQDGAIKILSGKGNNSVIELFWQSDFPIWKSGETARLMNASGEEMSSYRIP